MKKSIFGLIGSALFLTSISMHSPANANEPEFRWATGLDYTSGEYSDDLTTEILYVPFTGTALLGDFTFKATVPYIRIKGPGTVVGGGEIGPITRNRVPANITTQGGLGDVTASMTYTAYMQNNTMFVDFTGKVKLPTASSAKNLGTGKADFTTQIDMTKKTGDLNLFATAGYRFMGSSDTLPLQNGFLGSLGASVDVSNRASIGLIYDYRQSASINSANPSELTGFVSWKLAKKLRLQAYGIVGFSNGSPDGGAGIQISFQP